MNARVAVPLTYQSNALLKSPPERLYAGKTGLQVQHALPSGWSISLSTKLRKVRKQDKYPAVTH